MAVFAENFSSSLLFLLQLPHLGSLKHNLKKVLLLITSWATRLCSGFLLSALPICLYVSLYLCLYPLSLSPKPNLKYPACWPAGPPLSLSLTPSLSLSHPSLDPSLFPDKKFPVDSLFWLDKLFYYIDNYNLFIKDAIFIYESTRAYISRRREISFRVLEIIFTIFSAKIDKGRARFLGKGRARLRGGNFIRSTGSGKGGGGGSVGPFTSVMGGKYGLRKIVGEGGQKIWKFFFRLVKIPRGPKNFLKNVKIFWKNAIFTKKEGIL
jgi:hypothetical protein